MKFSEEKIQIMKHTFSLNMRLWIENFSTCQILNWEFIVPEDTENKTFWIIIFWRKFIFQKFRFLSSIFIQRSDFDQKFTSEKNFLTQFVPGKTTNFSLFVLILKGMILKPAFWLKIRVWNGIFWKKIRNLKWSFFLQNYQFLNREFFVLADFEKIFSNNRFVEREFFFWNLDFEFHFHWGSDFDKNITSKK